jgi:hypothetical protein
MKSVIIAALGLFLIAPAAYAEPGPPANRTAHGDIRVSGTQECFAVAPVQSAAVSVARCSPKGESDQEWRFNRYDGLLEVLSSGNSDLCLGHPGTLVVLALCATLNEHGYPLRLVQNPNETFTIRRASDGDVLSACLIQDTDLVVARWEREGTENCLSDLVLPGWDRT